MNIQSTFSSFSVNDLAEAKQFYGEVLGLTVSEKPDMGLDIALPGGGLVFVYEKGDYLPATFTVLNLVVDDIVLSVEELASQGIKMKHYDMGDFKADEKGIYWSDDSSKGPTIAWFTDPAGNVLSLIEKNKGDE